MTADLGSLPFYWRISDAPWQPSDPAPERLPFAFEWRADLGLLKQRARPETHAALEAVYSLDANVGYLQEGHALAESYGNDFLAALNRAAPSPGRALEVGCGGCYLLRRLKAAGWETHGVDPSPVARRAGARSQIPITAAFYGPDLALPPQDLIYHYDVLEHVEDPVAFLAAHRKHLAPGGLVVAAVPDCTQNIDRGDPSMALHEHLNYFDARSLEATFAAAGFEALTVAASDHGGVLYCTARVAPAPVKARGTETFDTFRAQLTTSLDRVTAFIDGGDGEVGIYVPLRALPYLGRARIDPQRLRFFDDDPGLHGRFLPGCGKPIESLEALTARPPARVFVASFSFGPLIAGRLREACPALTVATLSDLTA